MHPDKTKFIIFSRSNLTQNVDFVCNNNKEDQNHPENIVKLACVLFSDPIPAIKFLGVFFYPDLNFKYHISSLRKKLSKSLYALSTVKNTLNQKSLLLLYTVILFSTAISGMQFTFGHAPAQAQLMTFLNYKRQPTE